MKKKANPSPQKPKPAETQMLAIVDEASLLSDLRSLIQSARQRIAAVAYSTQTLLCWHVGRRLLNERLHGSRAAYGKQILVTVSRELTAEYGRGFSYAEIARMIQFSQPSRVGTFLCPRGQRRLFPRGYKNRAHPTRLHQAIEHAREQTARRLPDSRGRQ